MARNGEESEVKLREMDEDALDKPELVSSVAQALADIGGSPAEDELNAAPTRKDSKVDDQDDTDADDTDADDVDEDDQPTPDDEEGGEEEIELPEIPDAYYRSAARYGWKPEAIKDMVDNLGIDHVVTLLQNVHQKDNNMTNVFSDLGRKAKALDMNGSQAPPDVTVDTGDTAPKIDMEALKEKYGDDDPLVVLFAEQARQLNGMKESFQQLNTNLAVTQNQVSKQEQELEDNTRKSVNGFFGGKGMEPFAKFYGDLEDPASTWEKLSVGQKSNRDLVCQYADQILVGAKMHDDAMTLGEAMERAHMIVSEPIAESIVRTKIMKQVQKRSKARVVRPSRGKSKSKAKSLASGKPANKQELVDRTNERLSSLFKGLRN